MRWVMRSCDERTASALAHDASLPLPAARLLVQRGVERPEDAARFLAPQLAHLHPPQQMLGMERAVERLEEAIRRQEHIRIFGDYDVDGTSATVQLKTCIALLGGTSDHYIPHRIKDGYGIKKEDIERAVREGVRMAISVDTGVRAFEAADAARAAGLDLIITDHHLPEDGRLPECLALLNPNQPGCGYPTKELCGAGIAFKISQALLERAGRGALVASFLKMAAIATIADVVPLTGENRVIARLGLEALHRGTAGGLRELMRVAQLDALERPLKASDIGFRLGPRINAAGRMEVANEVVELFTTSDAARQRQLAVKLDVLNRERQAAEELILRAVFLRLEGEPHLSQAPVVVLEGDGWHRGVVGIVATRVVERTGRPSLVLSVDEDGMAHGSGRSIPAFHLLEALESAQVRPLLTRFGGHAHAAGFALPAERVPELRAALCSFAAERLSEEDFVPQLEIDAELPLEEVTPELWRTVQSLEPFGAGNREPVFVARNVRVPAAPRVLKEAHLKLRVAGESGPSYDALGWRMAERYQREPLLAGQRLDLAFSLDENYHPQYGGLQLTIRDYRVV